MSGVSHVTREAGVLHTDSQEKRVFIFSASALPASGDRGMSGRERLQVQVETILSGRGWEKEVFNCFWFCVLFFSFHICIFQFGAIFFLPQKAKTIKILDA